MAFSKKSEALQGAHLLQTDRARARYEFLALVILSGANAVSAVEGFAEKYWPYAMGVILLVALLLRLQHVHDPLLDHPNWRQGDTASIARNFAELRYNPLYPQTDYDGPPPNYVELELQILPFIAATLYKIFGVHELFGRLLAILFSLGSIVLVGGFARRLYASSFAGIVAAAFLAFFPGSVYYGRTFTPDVVMVFFLVAALWASFELLHGSMRSTAFVTATLALAYLAKPVAVLGIVPLTGMIWERRARSARDAIVHAVLLLVPLAILWLYDRAVASHAEWHWTSGITRLHVLPALYAAFSSFHAFRHKVSLFFGALGLLRMTMLGTLGFALAVLSCIAIPWTRPRSRLLLWGWLVGGLIYTFVVVTVERVDYYLFPLLPLAALVIGGASLLLAEHTAEIARGSMTPILTGAVALAVLVEGHVDVARYYHYDAPAYGDAVLLSRMLPAHSLVVMGHYGPDVLYYIGRFGWEEDPMLWTPFDEESAIRKGARYYISVEDNRLRRNTDLCAWLSRFPVVRAGTWRVYETDPHLVPRGAEAFWDAFRVADRAGSGRAFLDAHHVCVLRKR